MQITCARILQKLPSLWELPGCLTLSRNHQRERTRLINERGSGDKTTWWAEGTSPGWCDRHTTHPRLVSTVIWSPTSFFKCLEGESVSLRGSLGLTELEEFFRGAWELRIIYSDPNGRGFLREGVFELRREVTNSEKGMSWTEAGKSTAHFRSSKWLKWTNKGKVHFFFG